MSQLRHSLPVHQQSGYDSTYLVVTCTFKSEKGVLRGSIPCFTQVFWISHPAIGSVSPYPAHSYGRPLEV